MIHCIYEWHTPYLNCCLCEYLIYVTYIILFLISNFKIFFVIIQSAIVNFHTFAYIFVFMSSETFRKWKCKVQNYMMSKILITSHTFQLERTVGISGDWGQRSAISKDGIRDPRQCLGYCCSPWASCKSLFIMCWRVRPCKVWIIWFLSFMSKTGNTNRQVRTIYLLHYFLF